MSSFQAATLIVGIALLLLSSFGLGFIVGRRLYRRAVGGIADEIVDAFNEAERRAFRRNLNARR